MTQTKSSSIYRRAMILWLLLAFLAVLNGGFRAVLIPMWGEELGRVVSTLILASIILVVSFVLVRRIEVGTGRDTLFVIGLLWMVMTVLFEFGLGLVLGYPLERVLADYNIFQGRVWVLVLLAQLFGPYAVSSFRKKKPEIAQ